MPSKSQELPFIRREEITFYWNRSAVFVRSVIFILLSSAGRMDHQGSNQSRQFGAHVRGLDRVALSPQRRLPFSLLRRARCRQSPRSKRPPLLRQSAEAPSGCIRRAGAILKSGSAPRRPWKSSGDNPEDVLKAFSPSFLHASSFPCLRRAHVLVLFSALS